MNQFFVYAAEGMESEAVLAVEAAGGAVVRSWSAFPRSFLVEMPADAAAGMLSEVTIEAFDPVAGGVQNMETFAGLVAPESYRNVWGINRMGAPDIHASGNTGTGVRVVVVDTGGDTNHEDLTVTGGENFITPGGSFEDDNGHGTHVHGTIAALLNGLGVAGMAPDAEVYHAKVLSSSGSGSWADIASALQYCIDLTENGAVKVVTNHSYGGSGHPGAAVEAMYQAAADAGVHILAAAGNSGAGTDTVLYPAKFDSAIAVAATNLNDNRASFSSTGPAVEVAAPGLNIFSTTFNGRYGFKSGTSMATPHICGAFALAVAAGVEDPRAAIPTSTDRTDRSPEFGWGILDARKLVGDGAPPSYSRSVEFDGSFSHDPDGDIVSWRWDVDGSGVFKNLPGGATVRVVYDEDGSYDVGLEVTDDQGAVTVIRKVITVRGPAENIPPVADFVVTDMNGAGRGNGGMGPVVRVR